MNKNKRRWFEYIKEPLLWRNILLMALVLSIIPLLVLARYNHSSADDFAYGIRIHQAWTQTHNLFEVVKAIGQTVSIFWKGWQGTYSAIVLFTIQPAVWGEQYYFLTTYILLGFLVWGVFAFFRSWIGRRLENKYIADIISCCVLILYIQLVPTPVESLFWWNGASFYMIWNALMLVQLSRFLTVTHEKKCSILQCVAMSVLGILIAGSNYITALLTLEITVIFLAYCIYSRNSWKQAAIVLAVTLAGFVINVLAPGNAFRQQQYEIVPPVMAILKSFLYAYRWGITWTSDTLILILLLCLPFAIGIQVKAKVKTMQFPLWIKLLLLIGLFASTFTPTLYSGNVIGPERAQNMRFLLWVLLCFTTEFLLAEHAVNWLKKKGHSSVLEDLQAWFSPKKAVLLLSALMIALFLSGMRGYYFNQFECCTSASAVHDLLNGDAKEYDRVADERMQLLLGDEANVVLPPFTKRPYLLFFSDISTVPSERAMADYYGKESIVVSETD